MTTNDESGVSRRGRWLEQALVGALLGFVIGCAGENDGDEPGIGGSETMGNRAVSSGPLERPSDALTWRPCGALECAEVLVPIDHDAPEVGTIPIAINRARASAGVPYRGVILLNPGGPGGTGKDFADVIAEAMLLIAPGFDIVGFDPRGVGDSAALHCPLAIDVGQIYESAGVAGVFAEFEAVSQFCRQEDGPLLEHMSSRDVVADMDLIREALGHEEINFYGISYGTRLGALYAMTFPERARAIVLDAPVSPSADFIAFAEGQLQALVDTNAEFLADCARGELDCGSDDPEALFAAISADAAEEGARADFANLWSNLLSSSPGREQLAAIMRVFAEMQREGSDAPMEMIDVSDLLPDVSAIANVAIHCADNPAAPLSVSEAEALMASFEQRSPDFALHALSVLQCSRWTVPANPTPELAFTPRVPPLVIGGVQDVLTPLDWARDLAAGIPGSSQLVSEHWGHGALGAADAQCLVPILRNYFERLTPVPADTHCPASSL